METDDHEQDLFFFPVLKHIEFHHEFYTNNQLCDHAQGVQCYDPVASVIQASENVGFEVISEHEANGRKLWTITKTNNRNERCKCL